MCTPVILQNSLVNMIDIDVLGNVKCDSRVWILKCLFKRDFLNSQSFESKKEKQ